MLLLLLKRLLLLLKRLLLEQMLLLLLLLLKLWGTALLSFSICSPVYCLLACKASVSTTTYIIVVMKLLLHPIHITNTPLCIYHAVQACFFALKVIFRVDGGGGGANLGPFRLLLGAASRKLK